MTAGSDGVLVFRQSLLTAVLRAIGHLTLGTLVRTIIVVFAAFVVGASIRREWGLFWYDVDRSGWAVLGIVVADVGWTGFLLARAFVRERVEVDHAARVVRFRGMVWRTLTDPESGEAFGGGWLTGEASRRDLELPFSAVLGVEVFWAYTKVGSYRSQMRVLGPTVRVDVPWRLGRMRELESVLRAIARVTADPPAFATKQAGRRRGELLLRVGWVVAMIVVVALVVPWIVGG